MYMKVTELIALQHICPLTRSQLNDDKGCLLETDDWFWNY